MRIRPFEEADWPAVVARGAAWACTGWNDPDRDIDRKLAGGPDPDDHGLG